MKKTLSILLSGAMLLTVAPVSFATSAWPMVTSFAVNGDTVRMSVTGTPKFHAFTIDNPPRIVVEFTNTLSETKVKESMVNGPLIRRVRCGQFRNMPTKITRVVIDLSTMAEYTVERTGDEVVLTLKPSVPSTAPQAAPVSGAAAVTATAVAEKDPGYTLAQGAVVSTVTVSKIPEVIAEPVPDAQKTNVIPVPAPIVTTEKKKAPVAPAVKASAPAAQAATGRTGVSLPTKPITFDFQEADIRDVFRILALKSGINIIYGGDVSGTLTLRLDNVPFDQAFGTILAIKGLVSQEQGPGILRVVTPQKVAEERSLAVTFTKIFPLNYAKADEIKVNLDSIRTAEGRRGNISVDARTNSLIVTDTPEGLLSISSVISELDKKPEQVIIEAKIVEVVLNKSLDMGIQWQYANTLKNDPNNQIYIGASQAQTSSVAMGPNAVADATVVSPQSPGSGGTGAVFPASAVSGQIGTIAFGVVANEMRLTGILSALAQKGLSKLLSSPKVTTINNQQARIMVGQKIPYTTTTVSNSGTTQQTNFLDVGIKLTVTPTINSDQKITLQVHPEVSLFIRADPAGPVIGTREAQTTIIVSNGETVVIGGLITDEDRKQGTQVPLLGDLPIIGHLFRRDYKTKDRTELLVFITPQIIN